MKAFQASSTARKMAALTVTAGSALLVLDSAFVAQELGLVGRSFVLDLSPVALGYSLADFDGLVPWLMGCQIVFAVAALAGGFGMWRLRKWGRTVVEACGWVAVPYLALLLIVWLYDIVAKVPRLFGAEYALVGVGFAFMALVIVVPLLAGTEAAIVGGLVAVRRRAVRSAMR